MCDSAHVSLIFLVCQKTLRCEKKKKKHPDQHNVVQSTGLIHDTSVIIHLPPQKKTVCLEGRWMIAKQNMSEQTISMSLSKLIRNLVSPF